MGKKSNIAGIIDIGSNSIRLKIGQNKKGELVVLETASFPLLLGRDTFAEGKVNFEKAAKACDIIKNFRKLCTEYGADTIRVTAGASIREASNRSYILDQIYLKTGLSVELNDNQDEKLYIYKLMHMLLPENYKQSSLLVYSGSGNAGVALVKEGKIPYIQTIRTGSLRLSEMFGEVHEYSNEFSLLVEEYLKSFTDYISLDKSAKNFIACGNEMILISELTGAVKNGNFLVIEKSAFDALYANIKSKSVKIIAEEYNISEETAELLLPAMAVYGNLISFTRAEQILSPHVYFIDAVLYETLFPEVFAKIDSVIYESASIAARTTAIRFGCSEKHFSSVEGFAIAIFDKMKKLHGLSQKHKVILSVAAILHDVGKAINGREHPEHSCDIIKGLDIIGLNDSEIKMAACVALYHSTRKLSKSDAIFAAFSESDRVAISKLAAILRIADSLDRGHEKKFSFSDITIKIDKEFIIEITTNKNIELEEWSFCKKSVLFSEVFGLETVFKKKHIF